MDLRNDLSEESIVKLPYPKHKKLWSFVGVILMCAALLAVVGLLSLRSGGAWDGSGQRIVRVLVLDERTGRPLQNATVSLLQKRDQAIVDNLTPAEQTEILQSARKILITNERGEAAIAARFNGGGAITIFGRTGAVFVEGLLTITHPSYRVVEGTLPNFYQRSGFSLNEEAPTIKVFLPAK